MENAAVYVQILSVVFPNKSSYWLNIYTSKLHIDNTRICQRIPESDMGKVIKFDIRNYRNLCNTVYDLYESFTFS